MPLVVGIRFKDSGKIYFFDPNGMDGLAQGEHVIVETVRGPELAKVANSPREVSHEELVGELKPVMRRAEQADFDRMQSLNARQDDVLARCSEKIAEHNLPMRLIKAEYSFDGSRLTFFFTSEKRVDFRMLVRDLARLFRARIELRQIGPRDEAKLLGGIGPCGRLLCCATFLPDYARVSIKMAKDQDLPLNPIKISGVCGRLLCCLSYEHEQYLQIKGELPRRGAWVQTPDGPGEVVAVNVVKETVVVELAGSLVHEEFSPSQITEATDRVASLARSRAEEKITPLAQVEDLPLPGSRRERRRDSEPPPRREPKSSGERRLLRDEIDNPEVLDALAMLEEGLDEVHEDPRPIPPPPSPPQAPSEDPEEKAKTSGLRRLPGGPVPNRRPNQMPRRAADDPRPQPGMAQESSAEDSEEPASTPPAPGMPRRRRRRGHGHGDT